MKWTLKDKVVIASILPVEGSLLVKTLCRDIKERLKITADEIKESGLDSSDNGVTWKKNIKVEIDFTKDELALLNTSAQRISKEEKVSDDNLELIEKLIND